MGSDCYADLVRELVEYLGVDSTYAKVANCFGQLLGLELSTQAISDLVAEDAADVEAFYAQLPPPPPASEAALLVIQADGKGVPMVCPTPAEPKVRLGKGEKPNRKQEAVVTGLYTIAPHPRTPAEVVASLFHPEQSPVATTPQRLGPQHKPYWPTAGPSPPASSKAPAATSLRTVANFLGHALDQSRCRKPAAPTLRLPPMATGQPISVFIKRNVISVCTRSRARHKTCSKTKSWLILTCWPSRCLLSVLSSCQSSCRNARSSSRNAPHDQG